jgi:hypothetical protein
MKGFCINKSVKECKPCPICGKQPKAYSDLGYAANGFGAWVTLECKPFLRIPHKRVECGKASERRAYEGAIEIWNMSK